MKIKKFFKDYYLYILIFIIFLCIGLFVPTGGDDLEISSWYDNEGLFFLICKTLSLWKLFNGRILNNFFDMYLSKYPMLWSFVSAAVQSLTIYIILKLFKKEKNRNLIILFLILVLSVSSGVRAEIQLHKIGNISYAIPTLLIFYDIFLLMSKKNNNRGKDNILILILSLCCCLWIENLTIAITFINFYLFTYDYLKEKKANKYVMYSIIGCLIGCVILFLSPGFLNRYSSTTEGWTTIELIKHNFPSVLKTITLEFGFIYFIYSIVCLFLLKKEKGTIIFKLYFFLLLLYLFVINLFRIFAPFDYNLSIFYYKLTPIIATESKYTMVIEISMLVSIVFMIFKFGNGERRHKMIIMFLLALVSVAPMVLSPGYRNLVLLLYAFFMIICMLASQVTIRTDNQKTISILLIIVALIRLESYHYILYNAHKIEMNRLNLIENFRNNYSKDNNVLILPLQDINLFSNFNSNYYDIAFKKYYGLDEDAIIVYKDNFMFQEIKKERTKIEVILLREGKYYFTYMIFCENNLLFTADNEDNELNYNFEKGKHYSINVLIRNEKNEMIEKSVEVYYYD